MTSSNPILPGKSEVEKQLSLIQKSVFFRSREKPFDVLNYVVGVALQGKIKKISAKDIMKAVFESPDYEYASESTARFNASEMRKLVLKYYKSDGRDDPVIIQFRKDKKRKGKKMANYLPTLRFHSNHDALKYYLRGLHALSRPTPHSIFNADIYFLSSILEQPDNFPAYIGRIETEFLSMLIRGTSFPYEDLQEFLDLKPDDWRTHAVKGTMSLLKKDIPNASLHYRKAIACTPNEMHKHSWYQAYLLATDHSDEALASIQESARTNPTDASAYAFYGLCLYGARDFNRADFALKESLGLDDRCPLAHFASSLVCLAKANPKKALRHLEILETPYDKGRWFMPGLTIMACELALRNPCDATEMEYFNKTLTETANRLEKDKEFAEHCVKHRNYKGWETYCIESHAFKNIQSAIAFMAKDNFELAITELETAWQKGAPITIWLHMMPIFDPLLKHDRFTTLLRRRLEPPPPEEPNI